MHILSFRSNLLLMLLLLFVSGCASDDLPDGLTDILGTPGAMTAKIDGEDFIASGLFVTATLDEGVNGSYTLSVGGLNTSNGENTGVVILINGTDFSSLKDGDSFNGADSEDFALGAYTMDAGGVEIEGATGLSASTICTITKIDHTNQLISGTFSFNAIDDNNSSIVYQIRDGVFTEIEFD